MEEKSTMPKKMETIYPTTKPIKTYRFFMKPLKNEWKRRHESSVIPPTRRFCQDPIGYALDEASVEIPVERSENPIVVTTHAETTGVINRR